MENNSACSAKEPFALMVLGESMEPEFMNSSMITIDPGYTPTDGMYAVVAINNEHIFRKLSIKDGVTKLCPLNKSFKEHEVMKKDKFIFKGAVTQCRYKRIITHYDYQSSGEVIRKQSSNANRKGR